MRPATYDFMEQLLKNVLHDLSILAGDIVGPSNATWQDVAGTASANLQVLASQLDKARNGQAEPGITFPSPAECLPEEVA